MTITRSLVHAALLLTIPGLAANAAHAPSPLLASSASEDDAARAAIQHAVDAV